MKRTCKLAAAALLTAAVTVGTVTACAAAETAVTTETYAYLPDHSVYFYDVDDGYSWAFREVDTLAVAGVIQGRGDHLFYPRNAITRADFIVMLDRAYGKSSALASGAVTAQQDFSDVPSGQYYAKSVATVMRSAWFDQQRGQPRCLADHEPSGRDGVPQAHHRPHGADAARRRDHRIFRRGRGQKLCAGGCRRADERQGHRRHGRQTQPERARYARKMVMLSCFRI